MDLYEEERRLDAELDAFFTIEEERSPSPDATNDIMNDLDNFFLSDYDTVEGTTMDETLLYLEQADYIVSIRRAMDDNLEQLEAASTAQPDNVQLRDQVQNFRRLRDDFVATGRRDHLPEAIRIEEANYLMDLRSTYEEMMELWTSKAVCGEVTHEMLSDPDPNSEYIFLVFIVEYTDSYYHRVHSTTFSSRS